MTELVSHQDSEEEFEPTSIQANEQEQESYLASLEVLEEAKTVEGIKEVIRREDIQDLLKIDLVEDA